MKVLKSVDYWTRTQRKLRMILNSLDKDSWNPTFVAPISSGHFAEGRLLVKSITTFYPDSKIVIYDIGITEEHIEEIKTWCNVLYRKFKFGQYPPHVRRLSSYAFKMINVEAFQEFKTFFYIDTSIRFTGKNLHIFLQGVKNKDLLPFSIHTDPKHSVYASTDPRMYEYLPLPKIIGYMFEFQSGFQFVTDSPYTRYIFKWWYLCAMTENCVAPVGAISHCKPKEYRETRYTYMKCHRFDQAFYNIAELTYLFGETRGALEFNYIDRNWTNIDLDLVLKVEDTRNRTMQKYFNTIRIDRFSRMRNRLVLKCKNEQSNIQCDTYRIRD
ncbi:hypothetical protein M3Y97_00948900 [Aphelenchoides bicaudatus]|nr:hypothetical protein M3Y97_00948900 [Aphelenchoides bicaudatus]